MQQATQVLVMGLEAELSMDGGPGLLPPVGTAGSTERDHGRDVGAGPMHAAALEPCFHDQFASTFHGTAADRQSLTLEVGVAQHRQTCGEELRLVARAHLKKIFGSTVVNMSIIERFRGNKQTLY